MIFTKQNGIVVEFTDVELTQTLLRLEASNLRFCVGRDDVAFVNTGGSLLLLDSSWQIGRKLLESYLIGSDPTFPFTISFSLGSAAYTLGQALAGVGYVGPAITELSQVFMVQFGGSVFQGPQGEQGFRGSREPRGRLQTLTL